MIDADAQADGIGELQERVLVVLDDNTEGGDPVDTDRRSVVMQYGDLKDHLRERFAVYHLQSRESLKVSLSRALHGLCDRGLLVGLAREWIAYHGENDDARRIETGGKEPFGEREQRPRLQYLALTDEGRRVAQSLGDAVDVDHSPAGF